MGFYTREALACHEILDELGIPRALDDVPSMVVAYSLSQRMNLLHDAMLRFNVALRKFNEKHGGRDETWRDVLG